MSACPSCGHENAEDHDFCKSCGHYLRWDEAPEQSDTAVLKTVVPSAETLAALEEARPATAPFDQGAMRAPAPAEEAVRGDAAVVTLRLAEDASSAGGPLTASVEAGGEVELIGTVRNESGVVDDYDLSITGLPAEWWTIAPSVVYLVPFGAESGSFEQEVTVRLHPPRLPDAEAGLWPIRLVAMSRARGTEAGSAGAGLVIAPFEEFECRAVPERRRGEGSARFDVPVRNRGNAPLTVSFQGEDPEGDMSFAFDPPILTLPVHGEGVSTVTVSAERLLRAAERERTFTVYAKGEDQALAGNATFVQEPSLAGDRLLLWRIVATLVAAVMLIGGSFMNWSNHPDGDPGTLKGVCTTDNANGCLRFDHYLRTLGKDLGLGEHPTSNNDTLTLLNIVTSLGFLTIVLGVLLLVGIRTGALAWMAGVVTVIGMVVFLITLGNSDTVASRFGAWVTLLGGVLALTAGALATASRRAA